MIINPTKNCRDDCIHIKACRRLQKIARNNNGVYIARHCTEDCTAYESIFNTFDEVTVHRIAYDAKYDMDDDTTISDIIRKHWEERMLEKAKEEGGKCWLIKKNY